MGKLLPRSCLWLSTECDFVGAVGNNCKTRLTRESRTADKAEYGALLAGYRMDGLENNMVKFIGIHL